MPRNYKMHVWEVQQAAQAILEFTAGKTFDDYLTDWVLRSAVERQINKIGGAATRLIINRDPNVQRIGGYAGRLGYGNTLDHSWPEVEPDEIWDFVQNALPTLLEEATAILEHEPVNQPVRGKPQRRKIIPLVARRKRQIRTLCRRHHVKRLDVFGSAVTGDFRPDESDIDCLVEFDDSAKGQRFETRFQLNEELEALFGRSVDLVVDSAIQNPYFRDAVNQTREPIYEGQQSSSPSHHHSLPLSGGDGFAPKRQFVPITLILFQKSHNRRTFGAKPVQRERVGVRARGGGGPPTKPLTTSPPTTNTQSQALQRTERPSHSKSHPLSPLPLPRT